MKPKHLNLTELLQTSPQTLQVGKSDLKKMRQAEKWTKWTWMRTYGQHESGNLEDEHVHNLADAQMGRRKGNGYSFIN